VSQVEAALESVREILIEILGDGIPIEMDSTFAGDLGLQSVEFVALAELLHDRYPGLDLVEWVTKMPAEDVSEIRVSQLAELVAWHGGRS
jgi:acyl carrier protein